MWSCVAFMMVECRSFGQFLGAEFLVSGVDVGLGNTFWNERCGGDH